MSRHSSRKCSLAIETPIDERAPNNPLNAFLVYNNNNNHTNNSSNSVLLTGNDSSDSISPSTPPVSRRDDNERILIHHGNPPDYSPMIQKSSSLPNLQDTGTNVNTTMFGNRRISICDLNNINDEINHQHHNQHHHSQPNNQYDSLMYLNLSTTDTPNTPRNLIHRSKTVHELPTNKEQQQEDALPPIYFNEQFSHFHFRNHKRRNSVALKFEEPKIL